MTTPEPTVRVAKYGVSCLPRNHPSYRHFVVWVTERSPGKWGVSDGCDIYDADGKASWQPLPSEQREEWRARHHFDLDTALTLAKRIAPTLVVNGYTVADALAAGAAR